MRTEIGSCWLEACRYGRLETCATDVGGEEVAAAGAVGFDLESAAVFGESVEHFFGERDVGDFLWVLAGDIDLPAGGFGAEEEGGGELGALLDADGATTGAGARAVDDGGKAVVGRIDAVTEFAQGVEEGGLGALAHARDAGKLIYIPSEADEGGEEAGGGAGVADEEFEGGGCGVTLWYFAAEAANGDGAVAGFAGIGGDMDLEAEFLEAIGHDLGVFAPEGALKDGFAVTQRGEDEGAVGDAFGAGDGDLGLHRLVERDDFDELGQGHVIPARGSWRGSSRRRGAAWLC